MLDEGVPDIYSAQEKTLHHTIIYTVNYGVGMVLGIVIPHVDYSMMQFLMDRSLLYPSPTLQLQEFRLRYGFPLAHLEKKTGIQIVFDPRKHFTANVVSLIFMQGKWVLRCFLSTRGFVIVLYFSLAKIRASDSILFFF